LTAARFRQGVILFSRSPNGSGGVRSGNAMFDIAWRELVIVGVVALIVVAPRLWR
jgi:hypothetical protein